MPRKYTVVLDEADNDILLKLKSQYEAQLKKSLSVAELMRIVLRERTNAAA